VIQYKARATTRTEAAGSATQLELACLIQALTWFSSILRLGKFIIRTDHVSLTHLKSLNTVRTVSYCVTQFCWTPLTIRSNMPKGKSHSLPDALSRRPFSEQEVREAESSAVELEPLYLTAITDAYFDEIPSTVESRAKSHSRHYRRHAQVLTFAPIELQDVVEPQLPRRKRPTKGTPLSRNRNYRRQSLRRKKSLVTQRTSHQLRCKRKTRTRTLGRS
jgi:hypothetical protein